MIDLTKITITEFIRQCKSKEIDVMSFYLKLISYIKRRDASLMAFQAFDENWVLNQVQSLEERMAGSHSSARLYGIPMTVKDVINTRYLPTERGSAYWKGYMAGNNARIVDLMEYEGAINLGKTVTAELAVHHPGPTRNQHNLLYSTGTSSMGSAVSVAAGMALASFGTQTGSSIIRPASYTGIFGFKPSYGTIPRTGVLKTTDTLDHVGFFANHIEDVQILFDTFRVRGINYPISDKMLRERAMYNVKNIKVGIINPRYLWVNYQNYVKDQFNQFIDKLRTVLEMDVSEIEDDGFFNESHNIHNILYDKSLAYYFKKESKDKAVISQTLHSMVSHGEIITPQEFHEALLRQERMQKDFDRKFSSFDILLTPSTANIAPKADNYREVDDTGLIWSLLGVPSLNIPLFRGPDNMPFGLQAVGVKYSDYKILNIIENLTKIRFLQPNNEIVGAAAGINSIS